MILAPFVWVNELARLRGWRSAGAVLRRRRPVQAIPETAYVHPEWPQETISVSDPPGSIGGPADAAHLPGQQTIFLRRQPGSACKPRGSTARRIVARSIFAFAEAHVFGTVRFVLAFGSAISAAASSGISRATTCNSKIVIQPQIDNAYAGYGFMEIGAHPLSDGSVAPFALNFDVMAHETRPSPLSIRP
jgi:hypothetical protein